MYRLSALYPYKRAFITGAASGLGRALCKQLAYDRWHIGICDTDKRELEKTAKMIETLGGKAYSYCLDVSNVAEYEIVVGEFLSKTGGIDLLVNNAGISGYVGKMESCSIPDWQWIIGVNQMGVIHGCHYFIPTMKRQGYGYILNIASAAGFVNPPNMVGYNVTKAAVIALSETLLTELKSYNIHVSVSMTTFFRTNIMQHSKGSAELVKRGEKMVNKSKIEADDMAERILNGCGNNEFQLIYPFQSRFLFNLKRLSPTFFRWVLSKVTRGE